MSDLDEVREELDDLRSRMALVEIRMDQVRIDAVAARTSTRAADRTVTGFRAQLKADLAGLQAEVAQIVALLTTDATCRPARRPEKTQSASDRPLT
jgi:hypothetical protein